MFAMLRLSKEGWFVPLKEGERHTGVSKMLNPKEPTVEQALIVASKIWSI